MRNLAGRVLVVMVLLLSWPVSPSAVGPDDKNLLVVMSYDSQDTWSQSILSGLTEVLAGARHSLHVEFLDTRHHHDAAYFALHHQLLIKKYSTYPPELIVAADNAAYAFLLEHRAHLDNSLPLIFCGVNNLVTDGLADHKRVTGVNEAVDIPGTVNLGLRLFPQARRLVAITSTSGVGALNLDILRDSVGRFERPVAVSELLDLEKTAAADKLAELPKDALVIRLDNLRDGDGTSVSLEESMAVISVSSPVPVLTCWDFDIGRGALGGRVVSGRGQGRAAGEITRRILEGTDPGDIPVLMDSPNETMVDYAQLRRFAVDTGLLPPQTKVVGQPETVYTRYKAVIWTAAALFFVMGLGLLFLSSALLARRRAEGALRTSEARYRAYVDEAPSGIFIADGSGRYLDANPEACRITGYSRDELLGKYVHELLPLEALDEGQAHFARVKTLGVAGGELPFCRKDGELRWWSVNATALPDATFLAHVVDVTERRQGEEARAIFRQLLDDAEHIVVFKDTQLRYVLVNRAYTTLTGKGIAEVTGKTDVEAFSGLSTPEQIEVYMEADRRALALSPGQSLTVEEATLAADGSVRTYLTKKFPVYSEDGRLLGSGTMTSEITEIKRAQQQLQASIDMLGTVMDAIPADIYVMEPGTYKILYMNKAMQQRFGEEIIGRPCWQVLRHDSGPCSCCRLPLLLSGSEGETATWEELNPVTGRIFVNIDTMITWPDGRRVKLQVASDVSELRHVEAAVAASREELRQVIDLVPHFIFAKDLDGCYLLVNRTLAEAYRMTVTEMTGRFDRDILLDRDEVERLRRVDREVIASGELRHTEAVITLPGEQSPRYYSSVRVPFSIFGSKRPAVLGVSVDITEHKRDEEEKRLLTSQLHQAQKMEAIGTLAGGIAHDFNNILGAIIGYAEMLREDSPVGSSAYTDSDQVLKAGMRAKELVKQILAFSRQSAFERVVLQPASIVAEAVKLLRASLPATIIIDQDLEADCGLVLADPTHIHQIVMNLCTNAFHAMEGSGGTLGVHLRRITLREAIRADVGQPQPGDYVCLSIKDSGSGIIPEVRERIFDPYFTTKEVGKGTGLGLSTVHGIVEAHGGAIVCESVLGQGTTFHVYLPEVEAVEAAASARRDIAEAGGEHILLVDDEEILADLVKSMLERSGYRVTAKTGSLEALAVFQNHPESFDLVITDQTMPGMTGIDLARRLLQLRPGLPIILCTGYSSYLSEERARAMGITGFAMKPLVRKEIVALIQQVLERKVFP
jgi:PAS domain S-box-containing protein